MRQDAVRRTGIHTEELSSTLRADELMPHRRRRRSLWVIPVWSETNKNGTPCIWTQGVPLLVPTNSDRLQIILTLDCVCRNPIFLLVNSCTTLCVVMVVSTFPQLLSHPESFQVSSTLYRLEKVSWNTSCFRTVLLFIQFARAWAWLCQSQVLII